MFSGPRDDPTRRATLQRLQRGAQTPGQIAAEFPISRASLSRHFSALKAADLVRTEHRGQHIVYSRDLNRKKKTRRTTASKNPERISCLLALQPGITHFLCAAVGLAFQFEVTRIFRWRGELDPEFHQAMSIQETADHKPDTVMAVMQKGYLLNGRLVRPAMVVVSKAASGSSEKDNEKSEDGEKQDKST